MVKRKSIIPEPKSEKKIKADRTDGEVVCWDLTSFSDTTPNLIFKDLKSLAKKFVFSTKKLKKKRLIIKYDNYENSSFQT